VYADRATGNAALEALNGQVHAGGTHFWWWVGGGAVLLVVFLLVFALRNPDLRKDRQTEVMDNHEWDP